MELTWIDPSEIEYPLDMDAMGIDLEEGLSGLDAPPTRLYAPERPGDGSMFGNRRWQARTLDLPVWIEHPSRVRTTVADLVEMFRGPGRLVYSDGTTTRTLRDVYYDGGLEGFELSFTQWKRAVVSLRALDPFWYDDADSIVLGPAEADYAFSDAAVSFNQASAFSGAAVGISGSAGFNDAVSFNAADVAFSGGAIVTFPALSSPLGVWPTFTIHGPATYVRVTHLRTGEVIETLSSTNIPEGGNLVIVTRPEDRNVTIGGVDAWDKVTAETSATMQLLPGQFDQLTDSNGNPVVDSLGRPVVVQGEQDELAIILQGTTGVSYVQIAWEERWLTP